MSLEGCLDFILAAVLIDFSGNLGQTDPIEDGAADQAAGTAPDEGLTGLALLLGADIGLVVDVLADEREDLLWSAR